MGLGSVTAACFIEFCTYFWSSHYARAWYGMKRALCAMKQVTMATAVPELVGAPIFTFATRAIFARQISAPFQPLDLYVECCLLVLAGGDRSTASR